MGYAGFANGSLQNVRATLTQTASLLIINPPTDTSLDAAKLGGNLPASTDVIHNLNVDQTIVLSSGLNDTGVLSGGDSRYQPFEGMGAVSSWVLQFPRSG